MLFAAVEVADGIIAGETVKNAGDGDTCVVGGVGLSTRGWWSLDRQLCGTCLCGVP